MAEHITDIPVNTVVYAVGDVKREHPLTVVGYHGTHASTKLRWYMVCFDTDIKTGVGFLYSQKRDVGLAEKLNAISHCYVKGTLTDSRHHGWICVKDAVTGVLTRDAISARLVSMYGGEHGKI